MLGGLFVMGGKRPANEYAFAPMYRRRRIKKRRVASSSYGIYPPYANTKIDKREVLRRSLLWYLGVAPYTPNFTFDVTFRLCGLGPRVIRMPACNISNPHKGCHHEVDEGR